MSEYWYALLGRNVRMILNIRKVVALTMMMVTMMVRTRTSMSMGDRRDRVVPDGGDDSGGKHYI